MQRQLGVGVVGVGMLGRRHAEYLANRIPAARLVAVADARPESASTTAAALDVAHWYTAAGELLAHPDVEAVVIASSDAAHLDHIVAAAEARKEILCEKPITATLEEADRALAAVEEAGVGLQIGFMRRYDPAYVAAKRHIDEGRIGTPALFRSVHRGKDPYTSAERPAEAGLDPSAFVGSNIHDYDDARWLLGDEAVEVMAIGTRIVPPDEPQGIETGVTTIRFAGGAIGDVEYVSATRYGYDVRTEIIGERGTVFIGSSHHQGCVVATDQGIISTAMDHWLTRFGQTYLTELEDWVHRVLDGKPPAVTGQDGRAALEIAVAAQRALATGAPVKLPLD